MLTVSLLTGGKAKMKCTILLGLGLCCAAASMLNAPVEASATAPGSASAPAFESLVDGQMNTADILLSEDGVVSEQPVGSLFAEHLLVPESKIVAHVTVKNESTHTLWSSLELVQQQAAHTAFGDALTLGARVLGQETVIAQGQCGQAEKVALQLAAGASETIELSVRLGNLNGHDGQQALANLEIRAFATADPAVGSCDTHTPETSDVNGQLIDPAHSANRAHLSSTGQAVPHTTRFAALGGFVIVAGAALLLGNRNSRKHPPSSKVGHA